MPGIYKQSLKRQRVSLGRNYKFFPKLISVVNSLVALINDPEPEHPLRADLAEEYTKDRKKFLKNAEEFTKKHSEKRPSD